MAKIYISFVIGGLYFQSSMGKVVKPLTVIQPTNLWRHKSCSLLQASVWWSMVWGNKPTNYKINQKTKSKHTQSHLNKICDIIYVIKNMFSLVEKSNVHFFQIIKYNVLTDTILRNTFIYYYLSIYLFYFCITFGR